jgi:DNA-binding transcriptional LysR family regulator
MNTPHLRNLDLNLLRVFVALFDEGGVTRAGVRLGLTQSAVSHALNRLRYALGDELFVRGPSGMRPTPWAAEIAPRIRVALGQLQAALTPSGFTPALTDRRFVIAAGAYPASVLIPGVTARMLQEAPRASIRLRSPDPPVAEELDAGRCDLLISVFDRIPDRFDCEPVFSDRLVWAMRKEHPLAGRPLTLERLAELPHVLVAASGAPELVQNSVIDGGLERRVVFDDGLGEYLAAHGMERKVRVTAADLHSALAIVAGSDMAAPIPYGLFQLLGRALGLEAYEPPYPTAERSISILWRKDNDGPALQWLRGLLREAGAKFNEIRNGQ